MNKTSLTSVVVPNSITLIEQEAFRGCGGLNSITLPFVGERLDGLANTKFDYIFGGTSL